MPGYREELFAVCFCRFFAVSQPLLWASIAVRRVAVFTVRISRSFS
jgi:hypothetical protein